MLGGVQQRIVETIFDTWHRSLTLMAIHKTKTVYNFLRRDAKGSEIALIVIQRPK
jgi:hypothetical protein